MAKNTEEFDAMLESAMDGIADHIIDVVRLSVEQAIPEFMDWFVKAGGSIKIPQGKTLSDLAEQYVKEQLVDL